MTHAVPLHQVDAFTDEPFRGNPAAVCLLKGPRDAAWLQSVAAEMNLAETAFLWRAGAAYGLRWFTPTVEVPLCGHATLASAYIVMTELAPGRERVVFRTRQSGALTVTRDGTGFALDFPAHLRWQPGDPGPAAAALGAMPLEVVVSEHRMLLARFEAAQAGKRTKPGSAKT